ncbi:hypothetical protein [Campylobacter canadensis]|uniref:DUF1018 domain-containing protein n=1 Tax=Campylobacter canadensis TaxID=449520 RepID=A0ABS7WSZ9_9BACT|nr:hypothetical protein [Campylobacter canadensis]MBZ7987095.1 hypothetical protein [Campylobacter canadensis]MBZ7994709.1 hypothetical protein [Campylobacter canadensis]MBZ7996205.1 hypothetical protein [Campylobacter canadensis]MBZ7998131.1 hypothetical protein [Campylobacter canadensis]MBZ7999979.1 hypothetical protein [Campylobacter canadensis]
MKPSKEELIAQQQKNLTIAAIKEADRQLNSNNPRIKAKGEVRNVKKLLGLKTHQELCDLLKQKYGFSLQTTAIARWITRGMIPSKYVDIFNELIDEKLIKEQINKSRHNANLTSTSFNQVNTPVNTQVNQVNNLHFCYEDTFELLKYITPEIEKDLRNKLIQIKNFSLALNK